MNSIGGYDPYIKKPLVVKSGLFGNRVYQNEGMSENKGAGFRSYSNFTGWILKKFGFAEKMQWENQETIYVNKNSFCEWSIRVNETKKKGISDDAAFSKEMNESYRSHKKTGTRYELLSAVKKLFEDRVGKVKKAVDIQNSISKYIKFPKITTIETLIDFLKKSDFYKGVGIFTIARKKQEIGKLLDKLEKNPVQIPDDLSTSVDWALEQLFRELDPRLLNSMEEEYLKINALESETDKLEKLQIVMEGLPKEKKELLKLLLEFLKKQLDNDLTNEFKLAEFFGPIMIDTTQNVRELNIDSTIVIKKSHSKEVAEQLNATFEFLLENRDDVLKWLEK